MDDPPNLTGLPLLAVPLAGFTSVMAGYIIAIIILLVCVALMSAAEVAFFSVTRKEIDEMPDGLRKHVIKLLEKPKKLLATILVIHNGVNLSIVILSEFLKEEIIPAGTLNPIVSFLLQVVLITLIILLFGEVLPKVYGTQYPKTIIKFMVRPLRILNRLMVWITGPLMLSSAWFDKKGKNKNASLTSHDLEAVIELTRDETVTEEEKKIWKGIVEFGTISVKETMKPRVDVIGLDIESSFKEVMGVILQAGYSRLPVYSGSFDKIEGVLYIKNLLPHLGKEDFEWQTLIRNAYFVPENKKIDDLLKEFQDKKVHMAVVVDEYGGSAGIVTMEDIIEEIVGEINDEFDDEELVYSRLDNENFVFEGKTSLINMCRIIDIEYSDIEKYVADADTIAGLLLELNGKLPEREQIIDCDRLRFKVESVDKRRIKRVKVTKQSLEEEKQETAP